MIPEAAGDSRAVRVGVDLCATADVELAVGRFGDRYLRRVYTEAELAYCNAGGTRRFERLAARFAAKEATLKALRPSDDGINWRSIEVVRQPAGWCDVRLTGAMAELAQRDGVSAVALSITHEQGLAAAVVVAEVSSTVPSNPGVQA